MTRNFEAPCIPDWNSNESCFWPWGLVSDNFGMPNRSMSCCLGVPMPRPVRSAAGGWFNAAPIEQALWANMNEASINIMATVLIGTPFLTDS